MVRKKSPIIKFFDDETYAKIKEAADAQPDDFAALLLLIRMKWQCGSCCSSFAYG